MSRRGLSQGMGWDADERRDGIRSGDYDRRGAPQATRVARQVLRFSCSYAGRSLPPIHAYAVEDARSIAALRFGCSSGALSLVVKEITESSL